MSNKNISPVPSPKIRPSNLDNPAYSKFAWGRYWRLMRWMAGLAVGCTAIALSVFYYNYGMISIHLYIATSIAIIISIMLTAGLMGLVFLSSGTGHDEVIDNKSPPNWKEEEK
ncbi:hypothetical protein LPB140_10775 [Sphingorhabdus lutea]|uniref:Uncharacterized protein n=1 Tax=Sphingorhabdus lutea TaxID=1913578 RepID=A0A1L3JDI8_9SPHN|nr:hypothetical protein [Sphingorhabdus lutea]APG63192.1 hypothetical protein LPB140_10775 [Sphingorhabdus lutea]